MRLCSTFERVRKGEVAASDPSDLVVTQGVIRAAEEEAHEVERRAYRPAEAHLGRVLASAPGEAVGAAAVELFVQVAVAQKVGQRGREPGLGDCAREAARLRAARRQQAVDDEALLRGPGIGPAKGKGEGGENEGWLG